MNQSDTDENIHISPSFVIYMTLIGWIFEAMNAPLSKEEILIFIMV